MCWLIHRALICDQTLLSHEALPSKHNGSFLSLLFLVLLWIHNCFRSPVFPLLKHPSNVMEARGLNMSSDSTSLSYGSQCTRALRLGEGVRSVPIKWDSKIIYTPRNTHSRNWEDWLCKCAYVYRECAFRYNGLPFLNRIWQYAEKVPYVAFCLTRSFFLFEINVFKPIK